MPTRKDFKGKKKEKLQVELYDTPSLQSQQRIIAANNGANTSSNQESIDGLPQEIKSENVLETTIIL